MKPDRRGAPRRWDHLGTTGLRSTWVRLGALHQGGLQLMSGGRRRPKDGALCRLTAGDPLHPTVGVPEGLRRRTGTRGGLRRRAGRTRTTGCLRPTGGDFTQTTGGDFTRTTGGTFEMWTGGPPGRDGGFLQRAGVRPLAGVRTGHLLRRRGGLTVRLRPSRPSLLSLHLTLQRSARFPCLRSLLRNASLRCLRRFLHSGFRPSPRRAGPNRLLSRK